MRILRLRTAEGRARYEYAETQEVWTIAGKIRIVDLIVYLYLGQAFDDIIEHSTYDDSYGVLKAHAGQIATIQTMNYESYTICFGFLYQGGEAGIRLWRINFTIHDGIPGALGFHLFYIMSIETISPDLPRPK